MDKYRLVSLPNSPKLIFPNEAMVAWNPEIVAVYQAEGFTVISDGDPDYDNPHAIGFHHESYWIPRHMVDRRIAEEVDMEMPQAYGTVLEVLLSENTPLVAKHNRADRGEGKYFLQTEDDKKRFIAGVIAWNAYETKNNVVIDQQYINHIFQLVDQAIATGVVDPLIANALEYFSVEQYIKTPGVRYTSYRVVANAAGWIQSILILYSKHKKGEKATSNIQKKGPEEMIKIYDSIFFNSVSPFFIDSPSIVSNYARGGGVIDLLHLPEELTDEEMSVLRELGFEDPNQAMLPRDILVKALKIAKRYRFEDPCSGMDFIQEGTGDTAKYYLIEINPGPNVSAEEVDLDPQQYNPHEVRVELHRRLARKWGRRRRSHR